MNGAMSIVTNYFRELGAAALRGWNRFWFTPADPATYSLIRILAGWMILYTHAVWSIGLEDFFGANAWFTPDVTEVEASYHGTYFELISSPGLLWGIHVFALVCMFCLMIGLFSRPAAVLSAFFTVQYANRVPGATFGLDQINCLLAVYLVIGPCGARYSVDRLIARWKERKASAAAKEPAKELSKRKPLPKLDVAPSVGANIGIRLIQLHMCVIYLFAGLGKSGETWKNGEAMWISFASFEYQSLDMLWLGHFPSILALMTHVSIWWETVYCFLVWPRLSRPIIIALAVPLHLGIAFCMGMITFGCVMLIGNLAFVSPWLVRRVVERR